jgi:hypothetical protein
MLSTVKTQNNHLTQNTPISEQCSLWEHYNSQAYLAYQSKDIKQAIKYFSRSLIIGQQLKEHVFEEAFKKSGLDMLYFSSHNLAACLNAQNKGLLAKNILMELHEYLIELITNQFKPRKIRLEALANLDNSLFSLLSQLGFLNQTREIHQEIIRAEQIATCAYSKLLK